MLAIAIFLLAAAPAQHHARVAHPAHVSRFVHRGRVMRGSHRSIALTSKRLQVSTVSATPLRSPYRLPLDEAAGPTAKDIALNEDGTRCALIGQTICPRPTHMIVRMGEEGPAMLPKEAPH
jgi:hypothetical protein